MTKTTLALLAVITLAGCSTLTGGKTSGVVMQIGKDSYTVRTLSQNSTSAAKQEALTLANAACQKQTRSVMLTNEVTGIEEGTGQRFYDLNFMCLNSGDTDFQRIKREHLQQPAAEATH